MSPTSISQLVRIKLFFLFLFFLSVLPVVILQIFLHSFFIYFFKPSFCPLLFSLDSLVFLLQLSQRVALQRTNVKLCIRSFTNLYRRKGKQPTAWSSPSPTNACEYKRLRLKMGYLQLLSHLTLTPYLQSVSMLSVIDTWGCKETKTFHCVVQEM